MLLLTASDVTLAIHYSTDTVMAEERECPILLARTARRMGYCIGRM